MHFAMIYLINYGIMFISLEKILMQGCRKQTDIGRAGNNRNLEVSGRHAPPPQKKF